MIGAGENRHAPGHCALAVEKANPSATKPIP
jgi:hypothetical protein